MSGPQQHYAHDVLFLSLWHSRYVVVFIARVDFRSMSHCFARAGAAGPAPVSEEEMQAAMRGAEDDADAAAAAALEKEEANEAAEFNAEVWHSTHTDVIVAASLAVDPLL